MNEKVSKIAKVIGERIKRIDPGAEVILFGSHARGQASKESDWDILILIDQPKKNRSVEEKYRDEIFKLELEMGEPISTLIYNKSDWKYRHYTSPLYENINIEGIKIT
jgi:uncharacterized protein